MKTILSILVALNLCVGFASAQYVQGPTVRSGITNATTAPFMAAGGTAAPGPSTNVPTTCAIAVPIGAGGFGLTVNMSGTNATTTTNVTFTFQFSGDGVNWATNNDLSVIWNLTGVTYGANYTNIANTVANVGNASLVRLKSVHHTNTGSIFITNLNYSTR